MTTSCSFRSISKFLTVIIFYLDISSKAPTHTTEINWIHKLGYFLLTQQKPMADDWIIILDHSIQLGSKKIFLIYGIRESQIDFTRPLKLDDLTPFVLKAKDKWDGESINDILQDLEKKIGHIKYAVADHGSDIKKALELGEIPHIHDITHKIAILLEKIYKNDSDYIEFTKKMSELRCKLSQTQNAKVIPPKQKTKSRYQNIKIISDWGRKAIKYVKKNEKKEEELCAKMNWVLTFEKFIMELDLLNGLICQVEKIIKHNGLSETTVLKSKNIFKNKDKNCKRIRIFFNGLKEYLDTVSKQIPKTNNILCTSDIIESAFGKYKNYVSSNPMASVTNLILCLSAFTSKLTESEITIALESTPIAKIKEWTKIEIGDSLLKRRRIEFSNA